MQTAARPERDVQNESKITEDDLQEVPDIVLRWMARHAKGNDLATIGGVLADRRFGKH